MNIGIIADMITKDPSIVDDIPGFLERVNKLDIPQVRNVRFEVSREEYFTSIAEQNGGKATLDDVKAAMISLDSKPILDEANVRIEKVLNAISSGEVKTTQEMILKFSE